MQRSLTMTVAALTTSSPPTCQRAKQAGRAKRATSYLLPELRFYKDFTQARWQILPAPRRITIGEQYETNASRPPVARQEQNATLPRLRVQDAFRQRSCAFSRYHSPCWQPEKVAFFRAPSKKASRKAQLDWLMAPTQGWPKKASRKAKLDWLPATELCAIRSFTGLAARRKQAARRSLIG